MEYWISKLDLFLPYRILWYSATKIYLFAFFWFYKIQLVKVAIWKCLFKTVSYTESFKDFPNVLFSC